MIEKGRRDQSLLLTQAMGIFTTGLMFFVGKPQSIVSSDPYRAPIQTSGPTLFKPPRPEDFAK